jgi:putative hemolysin
MRPSHARLARRAGRPDNVGMRRERHDGRIRRVGSTRLVTTLAARAEDLAAAQRLRYRVFAEELGARLPTAADGVDRDEFDAHCEHLLLRNRLTREVVGTYRLLPPEGAARVGRLYAAAEFDLGDVAALPNLVEIGRACVQREYRSGMALALLLAGLARHIRARGYAYVMGCASLHVGDDPGGAALLCRDLVRDHAAPPGWRVRPRHPFDVRTSARGEPMPLPALLRGYLRLGALVCGEPAWDDAFRTADLVFLLPVARMNARYADRLRRAA